MRRHAIEQVVLSSSNRLSKRRPLAKRFKTDLIPMFVGALIACFFLSIVWTVRIQKVEEKKHGGKDVLDGLVPNTNTKFLKSTPPEEFPRFLKTITPTMTILMMITRMTIMREEEMMKSNNDRRKKRRKNEDKLQTSTRKISRTERKRRRE